jgi:hypothetical protein
MENPNRAGSDTISAPHRLRRATVAKLEREVRTSARRIDLNVFSQDLGESRETMVCLALEAQTSPLPQPTIVGFARKVCGMYYMGGELKSLAAMSLWRSVDFPQEFRECPDDMGRSSQFWAREIVRRQESAPQDSSRRRLLGWSRRD